MKHLLWKVHAANFLEEAIMNNPTAWVMHKPAVIFGMLLHKVGERASEINDPELNALMCRLAIYAISDPSQEDFDARATK